VIRELARHQNLATTQRYIDVSTDKLRGAVALVSQQRGALKRKALEDQVRLI
jgi:site-specific recombinase XerD